MLRSIQAAASLGVAPRRHGWFGDPGYRMEVISPFFDKAPTASPLRALVKALQPQEVRVFLPRHASGAAQCSEAMFDLVRGIAQAE